MKKWMEMTKSSRMMTSALFKGYLNNNLKWLAICPFSKCSSSSSNRSYKCKISLMELVRMTSIWTISPIWSRKKCFRSIWARQLHSNKRISSQLVWTWTMRLSTTGTRSETNLSRTSLSCRALGSQVRCPLSTCSRWLACQMTLRSTYCTQTVSSSQCSNNSSTLACRPTHLASTRAISPRRVQYNWTTCHCNIKASLRQHINPLKRLYPRCTTLRTCHCSWRIIIAVTDKNSRCQEATSCKIPSLKISS